MTIRITAITLMLFLFTDCIGNPAAPVHSKNASRHQKEQTGDSVHAEKEHTNAGGDSGLARHLCPLKYLVYFFWGAAAIIMGCIVLVMDLSTGFTQRYTDDYLRWAAETTRSIIRFFHDAGCSG